MRVLKQKIESGDWASLRPDQQDAAKCLGFLERVQSGDYLLYPHQPKANYLLIAKVKKDEPDGSYTYLAPEKSLDGDFRSCRGCVLLTSTPVPYNDTVLLPYVQSRLGPQARFYELKDVDKLNFTLERLQHIPREQSQPKRSITVRLNRIREVIGPTLPSLLQREFLRHDLSWFCFELFRRLGYSVQYQEGAGEHGSDLIVEIRSELLPRSLRVGVQIKAYTGMVSLGTFKEDLGPLLQGWETNALDYGVLLTTGLCVEECLEFLQEHNNQHADRQIVLIDGTKVGYLLMKAIGNFGTEEE